MEIIELKSAVLHSLDQNPGTPVFSQSALDGSAFLNEYIRKRLRRLEKSENCRISTTSSILGQTLDQALAWTDWQIFYPLSVRLAEQIFEYRKGSGRGADLLAAVFQYEQRLYFYTAVLDYREALVHQLQQQDERTALTLHPAQAVLPSAFTPVSLEFCTNLFDGSTRLVEKTEKGFAPLSRTLLNEQFDLSVKEKIQAARQIVQQLHEQSDELEQISRRAEFKQKVTESLAEKESVDLETVLEEIYEQEPERLIQAKARLQDQGLDHQRLTVPRSPAVTRLKTQKLVTDSGISLVLPVEALQDRNVIEFLPQPDGSLSILLKNVGHLKEKG